jgi:hypothetical protein
MTDESAVAAQIVRLLRQRPPGVWELIDAQETAQATDVVLRDTHGTPVAYARPATSDQSRERG